MNDNVFPGGYFILCALATKLLNNCNILDKINLKFNKACEVFVKSICGNIVC